MGILGNLFGGKKQEPEEVREPAEQAPAEKEAAPAEENRIGDRQLTANLAGTAMGMLAQGVDYGDPAGTRCQFGYLFWIEDHGLEGLFKLTTDKTTAYFAAQKDQLMRLNFTEELFQSTTETFLSMHKG